jgi:adenylosuccinate synthase
MANFQRRLSTSQVIAIICNQWGDTGKGKISDYLADWADVYARGTGGPNAGHTVVVKGIEKIYHQIPAGIVNDSEGKPTILGNGMVINLKSLTKELDDLKEDGLTYNNLMISRHAHVIMPYHIGRDKAKNQSMQKGGIGSTGRGIGPAYADKTSRRGIMIYELFDKDVLTKKIEKIKEFYPNQEINTEEIIQELQPYMERIKPFVKDTVTEIHKFLEQGKKILIEGAQGAGLSIDHGTYPYVTSSDCTINGTAGGIGISAKDVDLIIGIVKFPMMTRVGGGPFPTEFGGRRCEDYCAEEGHRKADELKEYNIPHEIINGKIKYNMQDPKIIEMMNSKDPFIQNVGVRLAASEYGATTGRPRRVGWTDAIFGKYSRRINGSSLIVLTKADCLAGAEEFKLCFGYQDQSGKIHEDFSKEEDFLRKVTPGYKTYKGYGDISHIREFHKLPDSLKEAIRDFEDFTDGEVIAVSVGADREETIFR